MQLLDKPVGMPMWAKDTMPEFFAQKILTLAKGFVIKADIAQTLDDAEAEMKGGMRTCRRTSKQENPARLWK